MHPTKRLRQETARIRRVAIEMGLLEASLSALERLDYYNGPAAGHPIHGARYYLIALYERTLDELRSRHPDVLSLHNGELTGKASILIADWKRLLPKVA